MVIGSVFSLRREDQTVIVILLYCSVGSSGQLRRRILETQGERCLPGHAHDQTQDGRRDVLDQTQDERRVLGHALDQTLDLTQLQGFPCSRAAPPGRAAAAVDLFDRCAG